MQHGSLTQKSRLEGPDVWEFRWSEKGPYGRRIYRKRRPFLLTLLECMAGTMGLEPATSAVTALENRNL
jgi:hypothetical protein